MMDSAATIVTSRKELVAAIRASVPNLVVQVDPAFIDLAEPGFNAAFEPQFSVLDPSVEKLVRSLRGKIICAVPPGLGGAGLLYHLVHTVQDQNAMVLHAPLQSLQPDAVRQSLATAQPPDAWLLTSALARRITDKIVGRRLVPELSRRALTYPGWESLFYLHLISDIGNPAWTRVLRFGDCRAPEIDPFGGVVYHGAYPNPLGGEFAVTKGEVESEYPDPRFGLNRILRGIKEDLTAVRDGLEAAYLDAICSWPFANGGIPFGEVPLGTYASVGGILRSIPNYKPARKASRVYQNETTVFRSISYYPKSKTSFVPENPAPEKAQVQLAVVPVLPRRSIDGLLERLGSFQLNLDFPSILRLFQLGYLTQEGNLLAITKKGDLLLQLLVRAGVTGHALYLILRLLENIQARESSYAVVLAKVAETLQVTMTDEAA